MKNIFRLSCVMLPLAIGTLANAKPVEYTFDKYHTNLTWSASHFGFSSPSGKFTDVDGKIILDEEKPSASSVNVVIKTDKISTGIKRFDKHLKSKDFFDVKKFPTATFVSEKVDVKKNKTAKVYGQLTLLGVTKPVVLDVKLNKIGENPYTKAQTAGFSVSSVIKRSDFGMNYALPGVSDEVMLTMEIETNPKK